MKICFVVPHFLPYVGGGEQLFYSIAKGMKERGHEVRVVTCKCFNAKGHQPYKEIDVYYYDWKSLFGHPVVKKADLSEHIKWADIVHTTLYTTATKARRISKKYKKPCVLTIYEVLGNKWFWFGQSPIKALLFDIYERLICLQKFSGYHAISDATKSDYEKFIGKREGLSRVYCSVNLPEIEKVRVEKADLRQYFNLKESETCFLYFGRPAPNKGIYVLERAVERLAEKGQIPANVRFCMILAQEPAGHRKKILERISKNNLNEIIKIRESVSRNELNSVCSTNP